MLLSIFIPFLIVISNFINIPIESKINNKYLKQAKKILNKNNTLIKIGVTGSYGKTSTKNIINNVLCDNYYTLSTPKSYNTIMGISKTINEYLNNNIEILICEMGAFRLKEIREMTEFVQPHISIITDIGHQHLETFKNIEEITNAKFEIINYSPENNIAIVNNDNIYIQNQIKNSNKHIITVGVSNKNSDIYVDNIKIENINNNIVTTFSIIDTTYKNPETINVNTMLLGRHNIYNILTAYATIKALENYNIYIKKEDFIESIYNMERIEHRLFVTKEKNTYIFDDSYNSNIKGFNNAIEVLSLMKGIKIIITPGIVDLNEKTKEYNQLIAEKLIIFDEVHLIDNLSSRYILEKLKEIGFNNIYVHKKFINAYNQIMNKYQNDEMVNVLIENDLPDNYLERKKNVR